MKHKVIIQEILQTEVEEEAESISDAINQVALKYSREEIILDASNHIRTSFLQQSDIHEEEQ